MPEGHTIHRAAADQQMWLGKQRLRITSPQGRFADGARQLDGQRLRVVDAYGKHLLYRFERDTLHVHLGLYGDFYLHEKPAPAPRETVRIRFEGKKHVVDLVGPNNCELMTDAKLDALLARLGPDPLRDDADPDRGWDRVRRSRTSIGLLLMDQQAIAGIGNIFRTEILWRLKIDPRTPGSALDRRTFDAIWADARRLLAIGMKHDLIVTVDSAKALKAPEKLKRSERFNIYNKSTCPRCGGSIDRYSIAGRKVFACPTCQPPPPDRTDTEQKPKVRRKFARGSGR